MNTTFSLSASCSAFALSSCDWRSPTNLSCSSFPDPEQHHLQRGPKIRVPFFMSKFSAEEVNLNLENTFVFGQWSFKSCQAILHSVIKCQKHFMGIQSKYIQIMQPSLKRWTKNFLDIISIVGDRSFTKKISYIVWWQNLFTSYRDSKTRAELLFCSAASFHPKNQIC